MAGEYGTYDYIYMFHEANQENVAGADLALEVATGDTTFTWMCYWPMQVLSFGFLVSVAFDYNVQTAEGVIALDKRVTFGSDTGRVEVCRVDLEDALAIGAVRYVLPPRANMFCHPGDQLVCEVVTAATGGGAIAGDWVPFVMLGVWTETPANILTAGSVQSWTQSALAQVV